MDLVGTLENIMGDLESSDVTFPDESSVPPPSKKPRIDQSLVTSTRIDKSSLTSISDQLLDIEHRMCVELERLRFSLPVTHIYNPLDYAAGTHQCFVRRYGNSKKRVLFLGMNPGPFGMAQNGVPFGDSKSVREWLQISGTIGKPSVEHPKRPICGLDLAKVEVSGSRFWGLMESLCGDPSDFFTNCYVHNYCPLCFMATSGKNITPPMLKVGERGPLQDICDRFLMEVIRLLEVDWVIGVGKYAEARSQIALKKSDVCLGGGKEVRVCHVTHPSPINPAANKDWTGLAISQLTDLGVLEIVKGTAEHR